MTKPKTSDTRGRILDATLGLISEKGYTGASTREIARMAEVSEPTLFRIFGSKEKLFGELLRNCTFLPRLRELVHELEGLPCEEAIETIGVHYIESLKGRKKFVRIISSEITTYPLEVRSAHMKMVDELCEIFSGYLHKLQADGLLRKFPADMGARIFIGMLFSYFNREAVLNGRNLTRAEIKKVVRHYVDIFLNGILNKECCPR